ncbi:sterol desaturase family protein [Alteraurantiacibacter buctensis]|nr:sterol desaturase family protein [Alteraurantiacibacter buctensis]
MAGRWLKLAGMAFTLGAVGAIAVAERTRPLRRQTVPALPRVTRNLMMGAMCLVVIAAIENPATRAVAARNSRKRRGLQHALGGIPGKAAAFLAMDYGFYLWHVATHKVPFLWRWHRVHHVDPDMDASTALRFHFLDMVVSLPWRLVQVRLSGVDPAMLARWQRFFFLSVLFHHSNTRLSPAWERALSRLITTPAMHGVHHAQDWHLMDSNWSSGVALWDHLHGTYRGEVPQDAITIGVDDPCAAQDVPLAGALKAPLLPSPRRARPLRLADGARIG